jgi:hypothetical protein
MRNRIVIDQLSRLLSEADQLDTETTVDRWFKKVGAFLTKAVGSSAAAEFNGLTEYNCYDLLALRVGHLQGLVTSAEAELTSATQPTSSKTQSLTAPVVQGHDQEAKEAAASVAERSYYSQRMGRGPASTALGLADLKRIFRAHFGELEQEGYFQEAFGYECVDAGFVPGSLGTDLQAELLLTLRKPELWPIHATIDNWSEDDLFDMLEFLHDHISAPIERRFHSFSSCGWHCSKFDREGGRLEFRQKTNRLLRAYESGFELSEQGEVLALSPTG